MELKTEPEKIIGRSILRKEAKDKLTGQAKYVDDLVFEGMLHGATVRSTHARGKIRKIVFDSKFDWSNFTIVTADDIPGQNHVLVIDTDQPLLAKTLINHPDEPVVLVAHENADRLREALSHIAIEVDPLPAVLSIDESLSAQTIVWGKDNIFKSYLVTRGDVDGQWSKAHAIIEGEYETGAQEQLYIEPNGIIAVASPNEGVTVWGSLQCPYYVHKALMPLFNFPKEKIRVIQTETGGGFGGKEEYPSIIAGHAALLAWKSGRPVKIIYDRAEDMTATTKRHPSKTKIKTAVDFSGRILAQEIDFILDGGAYLTLSPVVLSRGTIHSAGPYQYDHVRIRARAVATNTPPQGAFRGFGAPQSLFAIERHMDVIARHLQLDPVEVRRRNFVKQGGTLATNQIVRDPIDLQKLLDQALTQTNFLAKRDFFRRTNANSRIKRGIGISTFMHGAGFTGSGEKAMASVAGVELTSEGLVRVLAASTEIGQGKNTIFAQIVAEVLGIEVDQVEIAQPDTSKVPNSGPTVASRTAMIVGKLVENAAIGLKETLLQSGCLKPNYSPGDFSDAAKSYIERFGPLKNLSEYKQPSDIKWDDQKYEGDAYATYAWAVYVAEVAIDTTTYETHVEDFYALQEVGKVLNPSLAEGQIEGGVAQGIGYALYEKIIWREGRVQNGQMTNYIIPTAADVPSIRVEFIELPSNRGPGGAKGIGELPLDGPAPAILNAIENASGYCPTRIPFLPEDMLALVQAANKLAKPESL